MPSSKPPSEPRSARDLRAERLAVNGAVKHQDTKVPTDPLVVAANTFAAWVALGAPKAAPRANDPHRAMTERLGTAYSKFVSQNAALPQDVLPAAFKAAIMFYLNDRSDEVKAAFDAFFAYSPNSSAPPPAADIHDLQRAFSSWLREGQPTVQQGAMAASYERLLSLMQDCFSAFVTSHADAPEPELREAFYTHLKEALKRSGADAALRASLTRIHLDASPDNLLRSLRL